MNSILEMSFRSTYMFGSMIGGSERKFPVIHLIGGRKITDVKVGEENVTTWAYTENSYVDGETIYECLKRHGVSHKEVLKVVVTTVDTTGEKVVVRKECWVMNEE